jgi:hypothetical protein
LSETVSAWLAPRAREEEEEALLLAPMPSPFWDEGVEEVEIDLSDMDGSQLS